MDLGEKRRLSIDPQEYYDKSSVSIGDDKLEEVTLLPQYSDGAIRLRKMKSHWLILTSKRLLVINLVLAIFSTIVLAASTVIWHRSRPTRNAEHQPLPPSPAISAIDRELRPFSLTSPYIAPPGPETDRIWKELVNTGAMFPVEPDEFALVNDNPDTGIKLSHDPKGRYVGTLAATHQIHCVDSLRKGLWFHYEYYKSIGDDMFLDEDPVEDHMTHCVEMLRNAIMCAGDVSVITYNWKPGHEAPKGSFSSLHSCQKWEKLESWRTANNVTALLDVLERPVGIVDQKPESPYPTLENS